MEGASYKCTAKSVGERIFDNRSAFGKVIGKIVEAPFFWTRCSLHSFTKNAKFALAATDND